MDEYILFNNQNITFLFKWHVWLAIKITFKSLSDMSVTSNSLKVLCFIWNVSLFIHWKDSKFIWQEGRFILYGVFSLDTFNNLWSKFTTHSFTDILMQCRSQHERVNLIKSGKTISDIQTLMKICENFLISDSKLVLSIWTI